MRYLILLCCSLMLNACAQPTSNDNVATQQQQVTQQLQQFLYGASVNNAEAHDRFWADLQRQPL
ncbi:hypothetical protein [Idiomarina xiamenensis]|uniref:Uncharacterized protein n=1 Tax=Idiomarina xiamenensis 10-D-4 TaxID=740709 RepID=K2K9G3_9GAMM|nr:hypothetical protein [Idiomarina xiamenensis]EKE84428.1 hypothetical protein A10D4_05152 [Idiomarina xiamenensis 10-D-4]